MSYGLIARFQTPEALLVAAQRARAAGYRGLEAFSPFPVEGLAEALDFPRNGVPRAVLAGGIAGGLTGFLLQAWSAGWAFPYNVGNRPTFSWPAFVPITFELTVLGGAIAALVGMCWLNGLPALHHPVFESHHLAGGFCLCIRSTDPRFDLEATRAFLVGLGPQVVDHV